MRIVSLIPSGTEILCALGLNEHLVGISHECDFPEQVQHLPRVTYSFLDEGLSPSEIDDAVATAGLEQKPLYGIRGQMLRSLAPDLILTQGVCSVCAVTQDTVSETLACMPVDTLLPSASVLSLDGGTFAEILQDIVRVGASVGATTRAEACIARLRTAWPEGSIVTKAPLRVAMLEWPDPLWFAGHWVPEQVAAAGGVDIFGDAGKPSGRLAIKTLIEADPDVCVLMGCGLSLQQNTAHMHQLLENPDFASMRCVRERQVWAVDANGLFSRPGPRLVDGARVLAAIFAGRTPAENVALRCV